MARESEAVRKAREFREQLIRQEDAALREMSRQWVRMENKLMDQYKLLHAEIKEMMERGEAVPLQRIYNLQRYQQMMTEIAKEMPEYDAEAVRIITHYQRESFTLGLDAAEAVIMDTRPSDPMWNRVGKDAAQITAGFAGNGAPLGQLLQRDYGDLGVKITDALVEGVALGKGAFATAKDMRDAMGMEYNRSVRIARTEINRAYRIANADQYAKSGVVTKVLRLCAKQANTCLACLMMDGDEVPGGVLDDHPNGRCATIAVTVGGIYPQWEHGDVWFEQQDEKTQRAIMGPGRYEMWKKDGIDPHKMVMMKPNDVWGGSPTVISERELRERYMLVKGNPLMINVQPSLHSERSFSEKFASGELEKLRPEDVFSYGGPEGLRFSSYWENGPDQDSKIAEKIDQTLLQLEKNYPMQARINDQYNCTTQNVIVTDYSQAWFYLPDGENDRRYEGDNGFVLGQVFEVERRGVNTSVIGFRRNMLNTDIRLQDVIEHRASAIANNKVIETLSEDSVEGTAIHEWGHVFANQHMDNAMVHGSENAQAYWEWFKTLTEDEIRNGISDYATTNRGEFEAECFLEMQMPNPRPLAVKWWDFMQKVLNEGY